MRKIVFSETRRMYQAKRIIIALSLLFLVSASTIAQFVAASGESYNFVLKWGRSGTEDGQFNAPWGIAIAPNGDLYVADAANHRIQKFNSNGEFITKWGTLGNLESQFYYPYGVAVDSAGNVYVADSAHAIIQKFTSDGTFIAKWGSYGSGHGQFINPRGITIDAIGNVYVADTDNSRIEKFTLAGVYITTIGSFGTGDGQLKNPWDVDIDQSGNIYVADRGNYRIQKFTPEGTYVTKWGSAGSGDSQFNTAVGLAVDSTGNVYVADYMNDRIQKFTSYGELITKWGTHGTGNGQFWQPSRVAVDSSGYVFVVEEYSRRVQKFALSNQPPVAFDNSYSVDEDTTLTVAAPGVLANDNDPDGNPLTAELVTGTSSGSLTLNTDGSFAYTPGSNFHGSDSFTYKAKDASLYSNTATVTITINPVNDGPIANAGGPYSGFEGSSITLDASVSNDPDGDPLQYRWDFNGDGVWDSGPSSNPTISHAWNDDWTGSIRVEVSDGVLTDEAIAAITVSNVNPVVEAGPDQVVGEGDTVSFVGSFTDAGSADTHIMAWGFGDGGTASGSLTPTHVYTDNGVYTVTLTVTDDDGGAASDTLSVTVNEVSTTPTVSVKTSSCNPINSVSVFYYSGGWKEFGVTNEDGLASKDILPGTYTFRVSYAGASLDKTQNVASNPTVTFQTAAVSFSLLSSAGNPLSGGAQYYAGGWKTFGSGSTSSVMELLPVSYTFRVSYAGASLDKTQNVASNPTAIFQTKSVQFKLLDSSGAQELSANTQYYAGSWRTFGSGTASTTMELLPVSYTFRVGYGGASLDKTQNVATDQTVTFQTTAVTMSLIGSTGDSLSGGAQYYAGGWRTFGSGSTSSTMELLPVSYTFRVSYAGASLDKTQNVASSALIVFQTVPVTFKLLSSTGSELSGGAQYYAGGWKTFGSGSTSSTMELLPVSYTFRVSYGGASLDKTQNVASSLEVVFSTAVVHSSFGTCAKYYAGGWRDFTNNMEMIPVAYTFRFSDGTLDAMVAVVGGVVNTIH